MYIGAKTGISIGVGLTAVILAFAIYRIMASAGFAKDFTILENNCTQSIATAAGYMIGPMISSLAAYMLVTGRIIPWWHMIVWMCIVSIIGVLLAFPMKRRFINDEQLPFPEGRASGVVLDALYTGAAHAGMFKARLLGITALVTGLYQAIVSDGWMKLLQFKILRLDQWAGMKEPWVFHERLDTYYYAVATKVNGWIPDDPRHRHPPARAAPDARRRDAGRRRPDGDRGGHELPARRLRQLRDPRADHDPGRRHRRARRADRRGGADLARRDRQPVVAVVGRDDDGRRLAGQPGGAAGDLQGHLQAQREVRRARMCSKDIEFPLWISVVGIPLFSVLGAWVTHEFFGVPWLLAFISLPLIFVLSIICTNSMALTSWTPTGSMSKITQFTMGAIDRTNPASNLIPAAMTAEIAANSANLLSDIKPGYMLGAKPRQQAIGHVIGIFAGALACVPLFFLLFLQPDANGVRSVGRDRVGAVRVPGRAAVEGRGRDHRQGRERAALLGGRLDDRGGHQRGGDRDREDRDQGPLPAVRGVDRPRCRAAAGGDLRHVRRCADLLDHGPALPGARARAATSSGSKAWSRSAPD